MFRDATGDERVGELKQNRGPPREEQNDFPLKLSPDVTRPGMRSW